MTSPERQRRVKSRRRRSGLVNIKLGHSNPYWSSVRASCDNWLEFFSTCVPACTSTWLWAKLADSWAKLVSRIVELAAVVFCNDACKLAAVACSVLSWKAPREPARLERRRSPYR